MRSSSLVAVFLAVGALAMPVKRGNVVQVTVVTEVNYVDQNGNVVSKSYATSHQAAATPVPEANVITPSPPADDPSPAPQQDSESDSSLSGNALKTGWVEPGTEDFKAISVFHHNVHRTNHSVEKVTWDDTLAAAAQKWAESCVTEEVM